MNFDFRNKTIVITGATKGIGKAIANDFIKQGAELILTGTNIDEVNSLNQNKDKSQRVKYFYLDLLKDDSLNDFIDILKFYKKIDILVNNAGINKVNHVFDINFEDWESIIKVNLSGAFQLCKIIAKMMTEQKQGHIINIASIFGTITRSKRSTYTASKAGLIGLTKTLAVDLAPYDILVNSVSPGFIETELTKKILKEEEIIDLKSKIPLGRLGGTDEISKLVVFLASDLNTYLTGQNIIIDGGYTIV